MESRSQITVVVVDDSAFMRKSLSLMLESDPAIKVVAASANGRDALEQIRVHRPDVVTLDVEMPGMDGLTVLKRIMRETPVPVLMVSSMTTEGAQTTMDALHLGAVDFISKDLSFVSVDIVKIRDELVAKVKEIAGSRFLRLRFDQLRSHQPPAERPTSPVRLSRPLIRSLSREDFAACLVGVSTGGPLALLQVIPALPEDFSLPMVIAQHMPPHFTRTMAERLDGLSKIRVTEAEHGEVLEPGRVLIAPGGKHLSFSRSRGSLIVEISDEPRSALFRPSVDRMMITATEATPQPILGVIMTGMGRDGLEGSLAIKAAGGTIIAQNEESCVVYGMPRVVVEHRLADHVLSLDEMPGTLARVSKRRETRRVMCA